MKPVRKQEDSLPNCRGGQAASLLGLRTVASTGWQPVGPDRQAAGRPL
jgi:hypothetical protein